MVREKTKITENRNIFLFKRDFKNEVRQDESGGKDLIIRGYAIVFNDRTKIYDPYYGEYVEEILPTALEGTDLNEVYLFFNHNSENVLGKAGINLKLEIDEKGLFFEVNLPNTQLARDVYNLVEAKIIDGMSFGFCSSDYVDPVSNTRVIEHIDVLGEISIVTFPAYKDTAVIVKSEREKTSKENEKKQQREKALESIKKADSELEDKIKSFEKL